MNGKLLFATALILLTVHSHAQPTIVEHPSLRFDPAAARYTIDFPANADRPKALRSVSWSSKTLIDPTIDVEIRPHGNGEFRYAYTVGNGPMATQGFSLIKLLPIADISGIRRSASEQFAGLPTTRVRSKSPDESVAQRDKRLDVDKSYASAEKRLAEDTAKAVSVTRGWIPHILYSHVTRRTQLSLMPRFNDGNVNRAIYANTSLTFSFMSGALPGVVSVPLAAQIESPLLPSEDDRTDEETAAWRKWQNEDYKHVLTIAPSRERPEPFNRVTLLQSMREEIESWPDRGILQKSQATLIASGLDRIAATAGEPPALHDAAKKDLQNLLPVTVTGTAAPVVIQLVNLYISMLG